MFINSALPLILHVFSSGSCYSFCTSVGEAHDSPLISFLLYWPNLPPKKDELVYYFGPSCELKLCYFKILLKCNSMHDGGILELQHKFFIISHVIYKLIKSIIFEINSLEERTSTTSFIKNDSRIELKLSKINIFWRISMHPKRNHDHCIIRWCLFLSISGWTGIKNL